MSAFSASSRDDALAFGLVEADGDRALAAVDGQVVAGLLGVLAVGVLQERRAPGARVVAGARALDLDHLGAEVGEDLAGPGGGEDAAQVEHLDVRQRAGIRDHRGHLMRLCLCLCLLPGTVVA